METKNQDLNQPSQRTTVLSEHKRSLIIVIGVVLIVVLGIVVVVSAIRSRPESNSPVARLAPTAEPRSEMWIDPVTTNTSRNEQVTVNVMMDAHNTEINGADAVINFDPTFLRVVSIEEPNEPDREFILFNKQSDGQLQITTVKSNATDTKTPQMTIAVVTFQALKAGTTPVTFEYRPGSTIGSTIVRARDTENILDRATGTTIIIANQ